MLKLTFPPADFFDEDSQKFISLPGFELELEHSLLALSEWESKWEKPFLGESSLTPEETLDYVRCMIVTPEFPPDALDRLDDETVQQVVSYIERKMTATWFADSGSRGPRVETITSELIYYWMTTYQIPFECERWHLNRLMTLIRICDVKQNPPKKRSPEEVAQRNAEINRKRREQLGTKG